MAYLIGTGARNWNNPLNWSNVSGDVAREETLGSEVITAVADRDFSSDTGYWTKYTGTTINDSSDGLCKFTGKGSLLTGAANYCLRRNGVFSATGFYKVTFDARRTGGGTSLYVAVDYEYLPQSTITITDSMTTYTVYLQKTSQTGIVFGGSLGTVIELDNISIKEVTCFPSAIEPAIIDANSGTGTITIATTAASCASFDCSAMDEALTIAGSVVGLYNYGALILDDLLTWAFTGTAYLYMKATSSVAITMNGMAMTATNHANRIYFDGVGGTWTNQDACNFGNTSLYLKNGTWATNNQTITSTGSFVTEAGTKVLTLGSSTFNIGTWNNAVVTGFTFNYNTSTVNITYVSNLTGATTFYNLTFTGVTAYQSAVSLAADITVSNVFTPTGSNATNNRLLVSSNTIGTQCTITAATITASNVDFRDIKLAGACDKDLSAITGGSGDCGGNTDITFTTSETKYYKHTSGDCTWKDVSKWRTESGGSTTSTARFLPQDSHILDANSFTGTSTLTIDVPRRGSVDMSAVNQAVTTVLANAVEHYGNLILGANITPSGNYTRSLTGRRNYDLNTYGKSIYSLMQNAPNGLYVNKSSLEVSQSISLYGGVLDFNDFNITALSISGGRGNTGITTEELYLGNGLITLTQSSGYAFINVYKLYSEQSTIKFIPSGSLNITCQFNNSGSTGNYNIVWFSGSHTGYFDITGSNTFNELKIDPGRKVRVTAGTTQTVSKLNAVGTQAAPITIMSVTNAVHDLALASGQPNPQCDWLILHNSRCNVSFYAGNGSANVPSMGNGLLYNWYAVNTGKLAPTGWHVPTDAEFTTLVNYLGGTSVAGGKLKSTRTGLTPGWNSPNTGADNSSLFNALGAGNRGVDGSFGNINVYGSIWSSTANDATTSLRRRLGADSNDVYISTFNKVAGFSVRYLKDDSNWYAGMTIRDIDGNIYPTIKIGNQVWMASNLKTTKYNDGTAIPNVTVNGDWEALTTGAYCSYNNAAIVEYPSNNDGWVMRNMSKGMMNFF